MVARNAVLIVVAIVIVAVLGAMAGGLLQVGSPSCYLRISVLSANPPRIDALLPMSGGTCNELSTAIRNGDVINTHFEWGDTSTTDVRGASGPGVEAQHTYSSPGRYTVTATVRHMDGSLFESFSAVADMNIPMSIDWSYTASNKDVSFTATVQGGVSPYFYTWTFGDGVSGSGASTSHTYANYGDYFVSLDVTDSSQPFQDKTLGKQISVPPPPQPVVAFACNSNGWRIACTAGTDGGAPPYTYNWTFGDGMIGLGPQVTHTYLASGTYVVSVTATDSSGTKAISQQTLAIAPGADGCTTNCGAPTQPAPPSPVLRVVALVVEIVLFIVGAILLVVGLIKRRLVFIVVGAVLIVVGLIIPLVAGLF